MVMDSTPAPVQIAISDRILVLWTCMPRTYTDINLSSSDFIGDLSDGRQSRGALAIEGVDRSTIGLGTSFNPMPFQFDRQQILTYWGFRLTKQPYELH
jgi:hypothetical protein